MSLLPQHDHRVPHLHSPKIWAHVEYFEEHPIDHDEYVSRCDLHLVYLGFRAFICLVLCQTTDTKDFIILGHLTSDDPAATAELNIMAIKHKKLG